MSAMTNDLLEYARTQLSGHIPITRTEMDVWEVCESALNDASAAHPDCAFELYIMGNWVGGFDGVRLHDISSVDMSYVGDYCSFDIFLRK